MMIEMLVRTVGRLKAHVAALWAVLGLVLVLLLCRFLAPTQGFVYNAWEYEGRGFFDIIYLNRLGQLEAGIITPSSNCYRHYVNNRAANARYPSDRHDHDRLMPVAYYNSIHEEGDAHWMFYCTDFERGFRGWLLRADTMRK